MRAERLQHPESKAAQWPLQITQHSLVSTEVRYIELDDSLATKRARG